MVRADCQMNRVLDVGAENVTSGGKSVVTDHVRAMVQGPKSSFPCDMFFARETS